MATISRGAVERANTIEENRNVLSELIRKNEFVDPSQKELEKLFTRLNDPNAREINKDMKSYEPAWHNKKVTDRIYGPIPGFPSGSWWGIRMDCSRDRMHDPFSGSVQCGPVGAVSICTSHSNEDVDLGDFFTFTGQPCEDEDGYVGSLVGDKEQTQGNGSLVLNFENRVPLRVIRSYNLSNEYSPKTGCRYDGLYMVADYWIGVSPQNDTRCYKFALKRLFHQEPPPWKLNLASNSVVQLPVLKQYSRNCNLQDQGTSTSRTDGANVNIYDTIISRRISRKRFQNRDGKMLKAVKSPRKRGAKLDEASSELEATQSSSSAQGPKSTTMMLQVLPSRKIVSTDHRNVHVSAIVTRRVSKKLSNNITDNKLLPDCTVNKSWNIVRGNEAQLLGNEGEEEGPATQSPRLQNTNISIRTDLYDSSHNLKQNVKKCGSSNIHGAGNFKPRVLGVPRRELHLAGMDSSPGSSRTISSVKMERVKSVDNQLSKRNLHHIFCQDKNKPANTTMDSFPNRDTCVVSSSPIFKTTSSTINDSRTENEVLEDLEDLEVRKNKCLHRVEHSYASRSTKSLLLEGYCRNSVSQVTNHEEDTYESRGRGCRSPTDGEKRDGEKKAKSCEPEAVGSFESPVKEPDLRKTEETSLAKSISSSSLSQSPPFMGFVSPERSSSGVQLSWSESSIIMNSLTLEKMLDIITEEKSSPMAKMLISNVIGFPTTGSPHLFEKSKKPETHICTSFTDKGSQNSNSKINSNKLPKTDITVSSIKMRSRAEEVTVNSTNAKTSSSVNLQNLGKPNFRQFKRLENSRQQKIIEIIYAGEEPDVIQASADTNSNSNTANDQLPIAASTSAEEEQDVSTSDTASSSESVEEAKEFSKKSNSSRNLVTARLYNDKPRSSAAKYTIRRHNSEHESQREERKENDVLLRVQDNQESNGSLSSPEKKTRVSRNEDTVDFCRSKSMKGFVESCNTNKSAQRTEPRLTMMRGNKLWKQNNPEPQRPDIPSLSKSSASQTANGECNPRIITRSKCLQNSILGRETTVETSRSEVDMESTLNVVNTGSLEWNQSLESPDSNQISRKKLAHQSATILGLRSTGRVEEADKNVGYKVSKDKSSEKMRLIERSGVQVKRKMEIANLFIDMNMSPRSQMSKSKLRSKRSLQDTNGLRRRSCPAVVNRGMKRRNDDPIKHSTSPLKRMKKTVQVQSSSLQIRSAVTSERGVSLRKRMKNQDSPTNNNHNNNNNNKNSVKRIGKTEKVITKIKKPMKSSTRNLVANKNTINRLRSPAEIPKRREAAMRTRSGRSARSMTVGRLGLRRALLPGTEAYARKKKKKKEKQKQMVEKVQKQRTIPAKQLPPKKKLIEFGLNKAKLDYKIYKGTSDAKKPKMVSVMTQCSLIREPPRYSASLAAVHPTQRNNQPNLRRGSDSESECIYSSHDSGMDQIKNEIIELIELKSETLDDDVASCHEENDEIEENRVRANPNSAFNYASTSSKKHQMNSTQNRLNIDGSQVGNKICTPPLQRLTQSLGTFNAPGSSDTVPKRGFIRYVAGRRPSAFVPVKSVEGNLRIAQLKSIGFKPIKPGLFPDGVEEGSQYSRQITSDSPRISYSSAVVKRGVHEEYDKYTSEENNVVQYMDSKLCYEDIENEDMICGSYNKSRLSDVFIEKMEFVKLGTDLEEESNDNSVLREEDEENEAEELAKRDIKAWQSELDENSSNSEHTEQGVADSDGDVPWHGWKKIISNKETYFVGW